MFLDGAAVVLFLLPVPGWAATVILVAAARRRPRITALTERAIAAFILSAGASLAAFLASARLAGRPIPGDVAIAILALIAIIVSVPQVVWLLRYLNGGFGRGSESE